MIFQVTSKLKGTFVLRSLKHPLRKNQKIEINREILNADDLKMAIKKKILIPMEKNLIINQIELEESYRLVLVNKTDKLLILGQTRVGPKGKVFITKSILESSEVRAAKSVDSIEIIEMKGGKIKKEEKVKATVSEDSLEDKADKEQKNIKDSSVVSEDKTNEEQKDIKDSSAVSEDKAKEEQKDIKDSSAVSEDNLEDKTNEEQKDIKDSSALTWDFTKQSLEKSELISGPASIKYIKEENKDKKTKKTKKKSKMKRKISKKKSSKKKSSKKKSSKKKISGEKKSIIKKKDRNVEKSKEKEIKPIGVARPEKNSEEVIVELDSRGNPVKPSETLRHLIDDIKDGEVDFVDEEQEKQRVEERGLDIDFA